MTNGTIYNGALPGEEGRLARIGLMMFNDVVLRTAFDDGLDVIDLRAICCEARDYANPIEPSGRAAGRLRSQLRKHSAPSAAARILLGSGRNTKGICCAIFTQVYLLLARWSEYGWGEPMRRP